MDFKEYYLNQAGGSDYNVYRGRTSQRGSGLGGIFQKFFRWIVPLVKTHALPLLKTGAQAVGSEVVNSTANLAKDLIIGKNPGEAAKENVNIAITNLKNRTEKHLEGRGIKRKRKPKKNYIILKKRKLNKSYNSDIFDN